MYEGADVLTLPVMYSNTTHKLNQPSPWLGLCLASLRKFRTYKFNTFEIGLEKSKRPASLDWPFTLE